MNKIKRWFRKIGLCKVAKRSARSAFAFSTAFIAIIPVSAIIKIPCLVWVSAYVEDNESFPSWFSEMARSTTGFLFIFLIAFLICAICNVCRSFGSKTIKMSGGVGNIVVKYGDIFKQRGLKVIAFDECYTTTVGTRPQDINGDSVCGQYLRRYPIENMQCLIDGAGLLPEEKYSEFRGWTRYESGSLIKRDEFLLLAFARLDGRGRGIFHSRDEYLQALSRLWDELDSNYSQKDVSVTVLGAGVTRIGDDPPTLQELVDMMIYSYKLSKHRIKSTLSIIVSPRCDEDFSLNYVGDTL